MSKSENEKKLSYYEEEILGMSVEERLAGMRFSFQDREEQERNINNHVERKVEFDSDITSGVVYANVSNASSLYHYDKYNTPRGHGFAAEHANHLHDKLANLDYFGEGKVTLVGEEIDSNTGRIIKNGADRIVKGKQIQTKFCKTGSKCISECFENGKFRYISSDGSLMSIEVPYDMYDDAVKAMTKRIENGEVPGVYEPKYAEKLVKRSPFKYEQAKNIARAGTVESITFDAVNGAVVATSSFGISSLLTLATSIWSGEDYDIAIKKATYSGLKVSGITFATSILAGQLSRAGLNSVLIGSSEAIINTIGPKASATLINAFRNGSNIYGAAAMKSASKLLRGNMITGAISVAILSSSDVINIFRGRISGKQLFKNLTNTTVGVASGTAGWVAGATVGASIGSFIPIIGNAVGGFVGGVVGSLTAGTAGSKISSVVLDEFVEDDANEMIYIIEKEFQKLAEEYLLNRKEAENIVESMKKDLTGGFLQDMFSSFDRNEYSKKMLIKYIKLELEKRKRISLPSYNDMQKGLRHVLEELSE